MSRDEITLIIAVAGAAFGLTGAVLGILNTWRAFDRDRVRLTVRPVWLMFEDRDPGVGMVVTNLSYFPVTVTGLGFTVRGHRDERLTFIPSDIRGCRLPERMEARTSFTAILPIRTTDHPMCGLKKPPIQEEGETVEAFRERQRRHAWSRYFKTRDPKFRQAALLLTKNTRRNDQPQ